MLITGRFGSESRCKRAHVGTREAERLLRGELGCAERRRVVRHLLAGCPECQATVRLLWDFGDERFRHVRLHRRRGSE